MELTQEQKEVITKVAEMLYGHFDRLCDADQQILLDESGVTHAELNWVHHLLCKD